MKKKKKNKVTQSRADKDSYRIRKALDRKKGIICVSHLIHYGGPDNPLWLFCAHMGSARIMFDGLTTEDFLDMITGAKK